MKSSSNARIGITLHLLERFPVYSSASSSACCDPTLHFAAVKQEASAAFQAVPPLLSKVPFPCLFDCCVHHATVVRTVAATLNSDLIF